MAGEIRQKSEVDFVCTFGGLLINKMEPAAALQLGLIFTHAKGSILNVKSGKSECFIFLDVNQITQMEPGAALPLGFIFTQSMK